MRHVPTLLRRELGAYFLGPMAYLILLAFQVIAWLNFWELVDTLEPAPADRSRACATRMNTYISGSTPFWIALLVAVPRPDDAADRRGAAHRDDRDPADGPGDRDRDRRGEVAGGRGDVPASCSCRSPSICRSSTTRRGSTSTRARSSALAIGLTTMGMMFVAIGLFFSALTRNQIIAAIWTFVVLFLLVVLTLLVYYYAVPQQSSLGRGGAVRGGALPGAELRRGPARPRGSWRCTSRSCVFMLFLTVKVLEIRRRR